MPSGDGRIENGAAAILGGGPACGYFSLAID